MKRRTLDVIFSVGGVLLAALLLVLGVVLHNNEHFAKSYVADQLSQQQITFATADALKAAGTDPAITNSPCLNKYAGLNMTTGKQAECYANSFIAVHLAASAKGGGYAGLTYATLGTPQSDLRTQVAAATKASTSADPTKDPAVVALNTKLTAINNLRDTMFKGETLRGLLLTSYGFSVFGDKAQQAATVTFMGFILMLVLSGAGFVHYFMAARRHAEERSPSAAVTTSHA